MNVISSPEIAHFNPRSRTGSDRCRTAGGHTRRDFNPRSRTGSDVQPTWTSIPRRLFQPTLPHGERQSAGMTQKELSKFQPTLPHGERRRKPRMKIYTIDISTHAPARGATVSPDGFMAGVAHFNPRSRTGSDAATVVSPATSIPFQPTLPHGERLFQRGILVEPVLHFNPRSRTGSDHIAVLRQPVLAEDFNPRSRTGSDFPLFLLVIQSHNFNPRSRTGSDRSESL